MSNEKKSPRRAGLFLGALVILLSGLAMFFYSKHGINIYSSSLNNKIFISCGAAIACAVFSLFADKLGSFGVELVRPALAVAFLLLLYAILFLGAVFVAIDVDQYGPLIPGFALTIGSLGLGALFAVLGCALEKVKK